jgi:hypothetical protein
MSKRYEGPTVFEMLEKALQLAVSEERVPEERNIKLLIAQMHVVKVTNDTQVLITQYFFKKKTLNEITGITGQPGCCIREIAKSY